MHDITVNGGGGGEVNATAEAKDRNRLTAGLEITGRSLLGSAALTYSYQCEETQRGRDKQ